MVSIPNCANALCYWLALLEMGWAGGFRVTYKAQHFQSVKHNLTSFQWNCCALVVCDASRLLLISKNCFSSSARYPAVSTSSAKRKYVTTPRIAVGIPSRIKIHLQPDIPDTPSRCPMAYAKRPPHAPARAADTKRYPIRRASSFLL